MALSFWGICAPYPYVICLVDWRHRDRRAHFCFVLLFFFFFFFNFMRKRIYLFISTSSVHTLKDREKKRNDKVWVFWVNITISKLNLLYMYCLKLIGELRKEKKFRQQCCRNSTKIRREKDKKVERERRGISATLLPKFLCPNSCPC